MKSIQERYQQELALFKDSASVFSDTYPSITENLVKETFDPDADMLVKAMAFMSARLRGELEQQFPSALQSISQVLVPELMEPTPASTVLSFNPKVNLMSPLHLASGKRFLSQPVGEDEDGNSISCWFVNQWEVEILPINLADITVGKQSFNGQAFSQVLSLHFSVKRNPLENFEFSRLRLYFALPSSDASACIFSLSRHCQKAWVENASQVASLNNDAIRLPGLSCSSSTSGSLESTQNVQQLLSDYYVTPENLMFVDVALDDWQTRQGDQFTLHFAIEPSDILLPELKHHQVHLYATPSKNVFQQYAEPVSITAFDSEINVKVKNRQLAGNQPLEVCRVTEVTGHHSGQKQATVVENILQPSDTQKRGMYYNFYQKPSDVDYRCDAIIGLYRKQVTEPIEQLRIETRCTQGHWGSKVKSGQVNRSTPDSPDIATFTNITDASEYVPADLVTKDAWQIVSDQNISSLTLSSATDLQAFLLHYLPRAQDDAAKQKANRHRIHSIVNVKQYAVDEIVNRHLIRGVRFDITLRFSHFNGAGDLYLFFAITNAAIQYKTPLNSFAKVHFIDEVSQREVEWSNDMHRLMG